MQRYWPSHFSSHIGSEPLRLLEEQLTSKLIPFAAITIAIAATATGIVVSAAFADDIAGLDRTCFVASSLVLSDGRVGQVGAVQTREHDGKPATHVPSERETDARVNGANDVGLVQPVQDRPLVAMTSEPERDPAAGPLPGPEAPHALQS